MKKKKKANIPMRRKIAVVYSRALLFVKFSVVVFVLVFFCTNWFSSIKQEMLQNIYEFTSDIGFRLENVLIEGEYNVQQDDILATLNADKGTPVFALDLLAIKNNLQNNPWIKNVVIIERRLPNTIYIRLIERAPIAIWQVNGQVFLIDEDGYKITSNIGKFSNLLYVVGSDANIYANKLIQELSRYPELTKKVTSSVRYGNRRWDLNLQQGITVKMPDSAFARALDYLSELATKNMLFNQNYKIIDLRDLNNKVYTEKY